MHIRRTLKYATIALVGSGTLSVADAQSSSATLKAIKERGTISVGHRESLIPFSYYDQDQKVVGYSADICFRNHPVHRESRRRRQSQGHPRASQLVEPDSVAR